MMRIGGTEVEKAGRGHDPVAMLHRHQDLFPTRTSPLARRSRQLTCTLGTDDYETFRAVPGAGVY